MGCAACCRMLVPLSPPEAFALRKYVGQLPMDRRTHLLNRLNNTKDRVKRAGLWDRLNEVAEASSPVPDEELDPINRAYYALRIPCPFLENEMCSIYEARPAACRELLVTSPAELCQDLVQNPVTPLPVSMRIGSILGQVLGRLTNSPPRLIPLPMALEWAGRHEEEALKRHGDAVVPNADAGIAQGKDAQRPGPAKDAGDGYFIQPTVIADIAPTARIAQEEIFGPVLAVIKARNFEDALNIANNTEFGLTGSIYTGSRDKAERAMRDFHVGNLYINRKSTGAMVGAHPFGGFNMSGTDSKAGGPDYLYLFTQAKSIGEKISQ